jgi:long-subunit acyl-CoA synthetase (AMP-forming)
MPFSSTYPSIKYGQTNLLDFVFPKNEAPSEEPQWIDSANPKMYLSQRTGLEWIKRVGVGLKKTGLPRGERIMLFTTNHIYVPVAYLGIVGSGYVFTAANPAYTIPGKKKPRQIIDSFSKANANRQNWPTKSTTSAPK